MRRLLVRARASWRHAARRIDAALVPEAPASAEASNRDYRRIVLAIAGPALGFFIPSLVVAGVPVALWLPFTILTTAVAFAVSATFLLIPRHSWAAFLAPLGNGFVLAVIGIALRPYYHALDLLFPLVVSGHAVVHGIGPGLVAVVVATVVIPFALHDPATANASDVFYVALYLLGSALLPWVAWRLAERRARLLASLQRHSERQRDWLETILRSMDDAVVAVDGRGEIVVANEAYDQLLSAAGGAIEPLDERGRRMPHGRWPKARAARGESFEMSFTLSTRAGERRWYEARGGPIGRGGPASGGVVVIRDISDRSLRSQQEEFMATASHELRTPIAALHGYVQLLERRLDPNVMPREAEFARIALSQTRRLGQLLERLFDLARLQSGRLDVETQPTELVEVVRRAILAARPLAPDREYRLEIEAEPAVKADPDRLEQVLLNLFTNAIQHAPGSAQIDVRVGLDDGRAAVAVHDYGPGIPRQHLPRLFSRSGRGAKSGAGLGLGLFISRELIRAQRGSIVVTSEPGSGTTVTVHLPLVKDRPRPRVGGQA
jgi:signal transduction histidine kinase